MSVMPLSSIPRYIAGDIGPNKYYIAPERVARAALRDQDLTEVGVPRAKIDKEAFAARQFLQSEAHKFGTEVYDPINLLCNSRICRFYDTKIGVLYFNHDHVSLSAARAMSKQLGPVLERTAIPVPAPVPANNH